jgi:hypothetical protein
MREVGRDAMQDVIEDVVMDSLGVSVDIHARAVQARDRS